MENVMYTGHLLQVLASYESLTGDDHYRTHGFDLVWSDDQREAIGTPEPHQPNDTFRGRVVLVHGYGDVGGSLDFIRKRLETEGFQCISPSLVPSDAKFGLEDLAIKLQREIESQFGKYSEFAIVGFSMGGLLARYYVQELGGAGFCRAIFTISTPHYGTLAAYLHSGRGALQMRPGSLFLENLNTNHGGCDSTLAVAYWTPLDVMVFPSCHSRWRRKRNVLIWEKHHAGMLSNSMLTRHITRTLATIDLMPTFASRCFNCSSTVPAIGVGWESPGCRVRGGPTGW